MTPDAATRGLPSGKATDPGWLLMTAMRIAIVSIYFLETTIPLARHLAAIPGVTVHLISALPLGDRNAFVLDFRTVTPKAGFNRTLLPEVANPRLLSYMSPFSTQAFFFHNGRQNLFRNIRLAWELASYLRTNQFDVLHFVGSNPFFVLLHLLLPSRVNVHSLHEVTGHDGSFSLRHRLLFSLIVLKRGLHPILHSRASRDRYVAFARHFTRISSSANRATIIPFGLFETYRCFQHTAPSRKDNQILFLGRITPSKGVPYLIEAFKTVVQTVPDARLVIAGHGRVESSTEGYDIEIQNKVLSNEEIVYLNQTSTLVVCPYLSASQSGIPMVAFLYNNPIVATQVGAFPEVVEHGKSGMLVPPGDSQALAAALTELLRNPAKLSAMSDYIAHKYRHGASDLAWDAIAERTLTVYHSSLNRA